jgi:hypothetical protein
MQFQVQYSLAGDLVVGMSTTGSCEDGSEGFYGIVSTQ